MSECDELGHLRTTYQLGFYCVSCGIADELVDTDNVPVAQLDEARAERELYRSVLTELGKTTDN